MALPTQANPAVFVLCRRGQAKSMIHHQGITVRVPFDGRTVAIDLLSGKIANGSDAIQFRLESKGSELPLNEFSPFDWSLTIEAPGGGIVARRDSLAFEAPTDGYEPDFKFSMPASVGIQHWKSEIDQDFFVSFPTGRYGRFRVRLSAEKGKAYVECYLNPVPGDRNLEFDPAKQINR